MSLEIKYTPPPQLQVIDGRIIATLSIQDNAAAVATAAADRATTQAGIATNKAGEAATSASSANTSATNAATSEGNAEDFKDLSQSWAEGTEPGGVGTKSSKEWAEDASGFATDAETAKDEVFGLINPTGGQEGDLYIQNALGVLVPISPVELLKSISPFLKSPFSGMINFNRLIFFDGFNRSNSNTLGTTDNGLPWEVLEGVSWTITNNAARASTTPTGKSAVNVSALSTSKKFYVITSIPYQGGSNRQGGIGFFVDENNYIEFGIGVFEIIITTCISGVRTIQSTVIFGNNETNGLTYTFNIFLTHGTLVSNQLRINYVALGLGDLQKINLDSVYSIFAGNINYIGLVGLHSQKIVNNLAVYNL